MKSTSNIRDFKYFQNSLGFKINKLSKELKRYSSKIIQDYPSLGIPELFTLNVVGENKKEITLPLKNYPKIISDCKKQN